MAAFSISTDPIEAQARHFQSIPSLDPSIVASVHLEDSDDDLFWDAMLQDVKPGKYYYIYRSRSKKGKDATGCKQCRSYLPYLSKSFFICIDSDLWLLKEDLTKQHTAHDWVAQTYTYSFENHFCEKETLNTRYNAKYTGKPFDFSTFLDSLSKELYPLLVLYLSSAKGIGGITDKSIRSAFNTTCSMQEIRNNGAGFISRVHSQILTFLTPHLASIDMAAEKSYYLAKGLDESNAYLHWQGHHLHSIIANVGEALCGNRNEFIYDVLMTGFPVNGYAEVDLAHQDLEQILA